MPYFQYPDGFALLPPPFVMPLLKLSKSRRLLGLMWQHLPGVVSLVCQNLIDVCRLNTLRGPVSLFLLTLAESGERNRSGQIINGSPCTSREMLLYSRHKNELTTWKNKEELLKAQKKHCCQN